MSTIYLTPNYSFYAIPIFYILVLAPSWYGTTLVLRANNGKFDIANPRGDKYSTYLKKTVPSDTYTCYERARAAHQNGWENFPLFASAVICANIAKVDAGSLNAACATFLVLRAIYIPLYITISNSNYAPARSVVWAGSVGCCLYLLGKAGNIMANGGPLLA